MKKRLLLIFFIMLSCKPRNSEAEIKDAGGNAPSPSQRQSLVVIAGGFSSCPDDFAFDKAMRAGKTDQMYEMFFVRGLPGIIQKKTGTLPAVFSICYSGPDGLAANLTESISGRYAWNRGKLDKSAGQVKTFGIPQGEILTSINFLSAVKLEIQKYIDGKKAEGLGVDLFFIGHSYGGFTSINLASYFGEQFSGLVTVDPISMLTCQAKDMATKIFSTLTMQHPGCLTAPNDKFSQASIKNIQDLITKSGGKKWWYHTYQNAFPLLRSGKIANVSGSNPENQLFTIDSFKSIVTDGDYHSQMGRNELLWQSVVDRFSRIQP